MITLYRYFPPPLWEETNSEDDSYHTDDSSNDFDQDSISQFTSSHSTPSSNTTDSQSSLGSYGLTELFDKASLPLSPIKSNTDLDLYQRTIQSSSIKTKRRKSLLDLSDITSPHLNVSIPSRYKPLNMNPREIAYITFILRQRRIDVNKENLELYGRQLLYRPD